MSRHKCYICKQYKSASNFHKNARNKSGLATECKECKSEAAKIRRAKDPEKAKQQQNAWSKTFRDTNREQHTRLHKNGYGITQMVQLLTILSSRYGYEYKLPVGTDL